MQMGDEDEAIQQKEGPKRTKRRRQNSRADPNDMKKFQEPWNDSTLKKSAEHEALWSAHVLLTWNIDHAFF